MQATLEYIWREFAEKLGRFIRSRVADPSAAEDIRQDVFVKIQKRLGQLETPAAMEGWIYLIARNAVIDYYRTRKITSEVPDNLPAEDPGGDSELEELKAAFRRMVFSLPEPYREAVVLIEFEGLSQQELADRVGLTLPAAKSRVQRGRAKLREMLDACCSFEFDRRGRVIDCTPHANSDCEECGS